MNSHPEGFGDSLYGNREADIIVEGDARFFNSIRLNPHVCGAVQRVPVTRDSVQRNPAGRKVKSCARGSRFGIK